MTIYEKLLQVQTELKAPKSQRNTFGNYNYRNCEDILEAVKPLCAKVKALILLTDEIKNVADRYYVEATAQFIDIETAESVSVKANAREEETKKGMDGSQITGASSSYARKYALGGLLNIDDNKDSDSTNTGDKKDEPVIKPSQNQLDELKELGVDINAVATYYKTTVDGLSAAQIANVIANKKAKMKKEQSNG